MIEINNPRLVNVSNELKLLLKQELFYSFDGLVFFGLDLFQSKNKIIDLLKKQKQFFEKSYLSKIIKEDVYAKWESYIPTERNLALKQQQVCCSNVEITENTVSLACNYIHFKAKINCELYNETVDVIELLIQPNANNFHEINQCIQMTIIDSLTQFFGPYFISINNEGANYSWSSWDIDCDFLLRSKSEKLKQHYEYKISLKPYLDR